MARTTFYPKGEDQDALDLNEERRRVTIQLRSYDRRGKYSRELGNATIKFKGILIDEVFTIIRDALMKSGKLTWKDDEDKDGKIS